LYMRIDTGMGVLCYIISHELALGYLYILRIIDI